MLQNTQSSSLYHTVCSHSLSLLYIVSIFNFVLRPTHHFTTLLLSKFGRHPPSKISNESVTHPCTLPIQGSYF